MFCSPNPDMLIEFSLHVKITIVRIDYLELIHSHRYLATTSLKTQHELCTHFLLVAVQVEFCTEKCKVCFEVYCELSVVEG